LDFTRRLERFLATGKSTRYDWRREVDGNTVLPCNLRTASSILVNPKMVSRWLPTNGIAWGEGAHFILDDGFEPRLGELSAFSSPIPTRIRFDLSHSDWQQATTCELNLSARSDGTLFSFSHTGWPAISPEVKYQFQQRK